MTAISDLIEQRAMIERQIAEATLPMVQTAQDLLADKAVTKLVAALQPIFESLPPCESKTQIGNVLVVLTAVPNVLAVETGRMTDMLTPTTVSGDPLSPGPNTLPLA